MTIELVEPIPLSSEIARVLTSYDRWQIDALCHRQRKQIDGGLRTTGAHRHATGLVPKRKNMSRATQVLGP